LIVNLDPGNDELPYESDLSITELVRVEEVMDHLKLGPNGGLMYAMEYLDENYDWLQKFIKQIKPRHFVLFDFPGQVELFINSQSVKNLLRKLDKEQMRICAVNLIDSHHCVDPAKFIAGLLIALSSMLNLEMPQVNVLSKVDLIEKFQSKTSFDLEFYTEVLDLSYLTELLDEDVFTAKYKKLNEGIASIIEDFSLVSFVPLDIHDKGSILKVLQGVDKALGYTPSNEEELLIQQFVSAEPEEDVDEHLMV